MADEIIPGLEGVRYRVNADSQYIYQQVLSHELEQHHPYNVPHGQQARAGGQTFASAFLLMLSYTPFLKQHLLRTLVMMNEDLASVKPIIAEAWDEWDRQRRIHAADVAKSDSPSTQVLPHELQHDSLQPPPIIPQGQLVGGQAFASILLLVLSLESVLKQHLLRTLVMTNAELASLQPVIAEAWDRWDRLRRNASHATSHPCESGRS